MMTIDVLIELVKVALVNIINQRVKLERFIDKMVARLWCIFTNIVNIRRRSSVMIDFKVIWNRSSSV